MILRLSTPAARATIVLFALGLCPSLSYLSIRSARAAHEAGRGTPEGYERATQLEPGDARNWYLLGHYWQYNVEQPDLTRAIRAYQASLSFDPLSADTWLDLGTAFEFDGNTAEARKAFLEAKRTYPLSAEVSWRYGNFLLRQGELENAFDEIRLAVAADPKHGGEAFSRCWHADPDLDLILDRVLPANPQVYLAVIFDLAAEYQTEPALKVWSRLAALHPKLHLREAFPLVNLLIRGSRMELAERVWGETVGFSGLSTLPDPAGSVVWDGGFETGEVGGGFAWDYPASLNSVQIRLDTREKHSGRQSLRLQFNGKRILEFENACVIAPVQPSRAYHFSGWVRTRGLTTDEGVRFSLRSEEAPGARVVLTPEVHGSEPWTLVEASWTPEKDSHGVRICVRRNASGSLENEIRGTAWVDDVALIPENPGVRRP
jgi:tetratricopeptide (TPR) repeat protein